jgi:DNA-binding GntR family transcriptional regulator
MPIAVKLGAGPVDRWTTTEKRSALATKEESLRLGVAQGRPVVRLVRVRQAQGRNDLVEVTVMPFGAAASLASAGQAEERLSIEPAPAWVAELLDVAVSLPVLKLDRVVRGPSGRRIEWRLTYSPSAAAPGMSGVRRKLGAQNR